MALILWGSYHPAELVRTCQPALLRVTCHGEGKCPTVGVAATSRAPVAVRHGTDTRILLVQAAQRGINVEDCIDAAWEEIKDRKGQMIDGIFVKDA